MEDKIKQLLKAAGLPEGLSVFIKVEKEEEIEGAISNFKNAITPVLQQEGDRRATAATKTAVENYEKKHNLKEGKPIEQKKEDIQNPVTLPPEIAELFKKQQEEITALSSVVKGQQATIQQQERQTKINLMLKEAGIPEKLHSRFTISNEASEEEISTGITNFKQDLVDAGLASIGQPGQGRGVNVVEKTAEEAAKARNKGETFGNNTNVPGKKI